MQGNLKFFFFLPTLTSLVDGLSLAWPKEANDVEDHISKTLGVPGKYLIKWSPLQRLQGNLSFRFFVLTLSTLSTLLVLLTIVGCWDPSFDVVGSLVPFWFFFFFSFYFFFFWSTWLLALELSLGEEGEREGDLMDEESEKSTWGWCVGGVLTSKVLGVVETLGGFEITRVGNNQTSNPMVSPRRLGVAMYGRPKFPKEGKV